MSDQNDVSPPCANTTGWFCAEYFNSQNIIELCITLLSIGACAYILVITMTMIPSQDLFRQFTLHLYIPFVPFYAVASTKIILRYTAAFGTPFLSRAPNSWFSLATVYVGYVNQLQYQTLISAVMTILILGIKSPMTFKRFLSGRNNVKEFTVCHVLIHLTAVISTLSYATMDVVNASPFGLVLIDIAYYFMNGAFVVTGLATIVTFVTAFSVVIAYRRKQGASSRKGAVGSARQLMTLLVYSIPPTISSFVNSVISLDIVLAQILPPTALPVLDAIYELAAEIGTRCLLYRVVILTITTIIAFKQYRMVTIQILKCGAKKKRTVVRTVVATVDVSSRIAPVQTTKLH